MKRGGQNWFFFYAELKIIPTKLNIHIYWGINHGTVYSELQIEFIIISVVTD